MVFLTDGALWKGDKGSIHPILWASNLVRRVCRSTIQAEAYTAYTLQAGVEDGDVLRAAVTDIFGCLDVKRWEATSAKFVKQIWMTDCKKFGVDALESEVQRAFRQEIEHRDCVSSTRVARRQVTRFTTTTSQQMIS